MIPELEDFQKMLTTRIYLNLGEEHGHIFSNCGSCDPKEVKKKLNYFDGRDLYNLKVDLQLIALQLKLLDDMKISMDFRDEAIEDKARELAELTDD